MNHHKLLAIACVTVLPLMVVGCGSDNGGSGTVTIDVTDAPVDGVQKVEVQFSGVEIHGSKNRYSFYFCKDLSGGASTVSSTPCVTPDVKSIDLLKLTGGDSTALLSGATIAAGHYQWVRLMVDGATLVDSMGGTHTLTIPSGAETGLKLNRGFDVSVSGHANFTIDFDLRKSVHQTSSGYVLRPTLRIVDNSAIGAIAGTLNTASASATGCTPVVYVYQGASAIPNDLGSAGAPVVTAPVKMDTSGVYKYKAAFLDVGDYTVAFTCQAVADDPATDDAITFSGTANVSVTADTVTKHDFN